MNALLVASVLCTPTAEPVIVPARCSAITGISELATAPRYYFILFGGQSIPFRPRTAHTFATYVKVSPTTDGRVIVEPFTISWLPAEGPVQPLRLRAETGKNYSLEETFDIAAKEKARVSMWGPYEIDANRYELAAMQVSELNSGAVRYRVLDTLGRNLSVQHCVHAVTYADPDLHRLVQPVIQVGEPGTSHLAKRYVRVGAFVSMDKHDWLLPVLGLEKQFIVRREPGEFIPRAWW